MRKLGASVNRKDGHRTKVHRPIGTELWSEVKKIALRPDQGIS